MLLKLFKPQNLRFTYANYVFLHVTNVFYITITFALITSYTQQTDLFTYVTHT